jgi:hypothetical protein
VQQELIAEIPRTAIWPVVGTVDVNISIPNKTDFIDRDGSYIILKSAGNINSFKAEISGIAKGIENEFTRIGNLDNRVVVAGANEFSISTQKDIYIFSKHRIYDCIILTRDNYVMYTEYSRPININEVDTGH